VLRSAAAAAVISWAETQIENNRSANKKVFDSKRRSCAQGG